MKHKCPNQETGVISFNYYFYIWKSFLCFKACSAPTDRAPVPDRWRNMFQQCQHVKNSSQTTRICSSTEMHITRTTSSSDTHLFSLSWTLLLWKSHSGRTAALSSHSSCTYLSDIPQIRPNILYAPVFFLRICMHARFESFWGADLVTWRHKFPCFIGTLESFDIYRSITLESSISGFESYAESAETWMSKHNYRTNKPGGSAGRSGTNWKTGLRENINTHLASTFEQQYQDKPGINVSLLDGQRGE